MKSGNISPHVYVASTLAATSGGVWLFAEFGHHDRYFFAPFLALAVLWGFADYLRQRTGATQFHVTHGLPATSWLKKAVARYLTWGVVIWIAGLIYQTHSYYSTYLANTVFFEQFLQVYLVAGLPYFLLTLKLRASRVEDFYDPAVRLVLLAKLLLTASTRPRTAFLLRRALRNRYNRKVLLNLLMRAYFIPVMVIQVYTGYKNAVQMIHGDTYHYDLMAILVGITGLLWLADSLCASAAYCIESRWVNNRTRSIDMTLGGWLVCLCCYPPLNQVTGTVFPFAPSVVTDDYTALLIPDMTLLYILKIGEILLLFGLVYSDLSLGPSAANITLKRLQTRGPYGIVRHPATVCKLSLWWFQSLLYYEFWSWEIILGQIGWNAIYIMRALTEERHLKQYPEYRAYMQKVRYRFIPGLV